MLWRANRTAAEQPRVVEWAGRMTRPSTYPIEGYCVNCGEAAVLAWPRGRLMPENGTRFPDEVCQLCGCVGTIVSHNPSAIVLDRKTFRQR